MDWLEFFGRYGMPTVVLAAISMFFARQVWPFIMQAWQNQQLERREERIAFLNALTEERKAFKDVVESERGARIDERNLFLAALEGHRQQLASIAKTLEDANGNK